MAKKKEPEKLKIDNPPISQQITDTLELNYMPYTMSVIVSRAIPEIDGFKPSQRKLLYTMFKMGLLTGGRVKSADVVGQTMRLNPHGEQAIYETLVRLTRGNDTLLHPLIDSKGNFGKQYSKNMAYAASRYTEVKLDAICAEVFKDIDKNTVEFIDNYNGTTKEPILLPTTFPNILVSSNQGIAVGMASSICGFNLKEVCAATIAYIKDETVNLLKYISGPDYTTGGEFLYDEKELYSVYETGKGTFRTRAKYRYDKKNGIIEVYEIPYSTTSEAVIDKIISLVKTGKVKDILDVRDETGLEGLKIAIDIRKSANPEIIMQKLFSMTTLMDSYRCNFNLLIDKRPKTLGVRGIIKEWLVFRIDSIKRRLNYDLRKNKEKMHLLEGLSKILLDIDKAIKIIRGTEEDKDVIPNLMDGFKIDEIQADFIAEIKLRNLNKQYLLNKINELDDLKNEIDRIHDILGDESKVKNIIIDELRDIAKKYGRDRRTDVVYEIEEIKIDVDALIDDYPLKFFLTEHGYLKKIPLISLRSSGEQNIKEDDKIIAETETTNKAEVLFFSSKRTVYKMKAHELPDCKASSLGDYLPNILGLAQDEKIIFMTATTDFKGFLILGFENGKIAKITMESYSTKTNRKKLINAFSDKSTVIYAGYIREDSDFIIFRDNDKAALFSTSLIAEVGAKNSQGISVLTLKKNSLMSKMLPAEQFVSQETEYYRIKKLPATGHFIRNEDKSSNNIDIQLSL